MNTPAFRTWAVLSAGLFVAGTVYSADPAGGRTGTGASPAAVLQKGGRGTAKGPLPDPVLLDGSTQKAEKESENGMLGEFEIPGDEDVRNGKVGGTEKASPDSANDQSLPQNGGSAMGTRMEGTPGKLPKGGAAGGPEGPQGAQGQIPPGAEGAIGGPVGAGDPNAKPEGAQVGQLTGEPQGAAPEETAQKPPPVAIGDSAMQIQGIQNAPNVVGGQVPAGQTQQMEKNIGGSGKGAQGNNGNRGAEKGRTMQPGL